MPIVNLPWSYFTSAMCNTTDLSLDISFSKLSGLKPVSKTQSPKLDASLLVSLKTKNLSSTLIENNSQDESTQLPFKKRSYSDTESQGSTLKNAKRKCPDTMSVKQGPSPTIQYENSQPAVAKPNPKESTTMENVSEHDVLCGRGGATNVHPGNRFFRSLISKFRVQYLRSRKIDKPHISRSVVGEIRSRKGRFLKKDEKTGVWCEIGDDLAREKTSQALRQRAPDYRRQMMVEDQERLFKLTASPKKPTCATSSVLTQPAPESRWIASSNPGMPLLPPTPAPPVQTCLMNDRTDNYLMHTRGLSGFPQNHVNPQNLVHSRELVMEYLAVKKREAELQHHIQMVAELKLKFGLRYM